MKIVTIILLGLTLSACAGNRFGDSERMKSPCTCNNNLPEITNEANYVG